MTIYTNACRWCGTLESLHKLQPKMSANSKEPGWFLGVECLDCRALIAALSPITKERYLRAKDIASEVALRLRDEP